MYTDADYQFDAENIHGWKPAQWPEEYSCCDCDEIFIVTHVRGEDPTIICPICGSDDWAS